MRKTEQQMRDEFADRIMQLWDEAHAEPERLGLDGPLLEKVNEEKITKISELLAKLVESEIQRVEEIKRGLRRRDGGPTLCIRSCACKVIKVCEEIENPPPR